MRILSWSKIVNFFWVWCLLRNSNQSLKKIQLFLCKLCKIFVILYSLQFNTLFSQVVFVFTDPLHFPHPKNPSFGHPSHHYHKKLSDSSGISYLGNLLQHFFLFSTVFLQYSSKLIFKWKNIFSCHFAIHSSECLVCELHNWCLWFSG